MPAKRVLTLLVILLAGPVAAAPPEPPDVDNAAYLELLGNGGLGSVNYERALARGFHLRAGFAHWEDPHLFGGGEDRVTTYPVMLNVLPGAGRHRLELGLGMLFGREIHVDAGGGKTRSSFRSVTGTLGYRYQHLPSGFLFRAGLTPFYGLGNDYDAYPEKGFMLSTGVSFGFAF